MPVNASSPSAGRFAIVVRRAMLLGVATVAVLLAHGLVRFPTTLRASPEGVRGLVGDLAILALYGCVAWFGPAATERSSPLTLRLGALGGVAAGAILGGEMLLEYVVLPENNAGMGLAAYGLVLVLYLALSLWAALCTRSFQHGVLAAAWSAAIGTQIWFISVLALFYLFHGTPQQALVFQAEGDLADLLHSGMGDLDAFMMQDFMGAEFFHSLLMPLVAAGLGMLGGGAGWLLARKRS
jgi:hypothetical protein